MNNCLWAWHRFSGSKPKLAALKLQAKTGKVHFQFAEYKRASWDSLSLKLPPAVCGRGSTHACSPNCDCWFLISLFLFVSLLWPAILQSRTHACHLCSKTEKKKKLDFWNDAISRRATAEQSVRWFSSWAAFRQRLDATTPMVAHQFVWMTFIWRLWMLTQMGDSFVSRCMKWHFFSGALGRCTLCRRCFQLGG